MIGKENDKRFHFRLPEEDYNIIKTLATKYGMSTSRYIRLLIDMVVTDYKVKEREQKGGTGNANEQAIFNDKL